MPKRDRAAYMREYRLNKKLRIRETARHVIEGAIDHVAQALARQEAEAPIEAAIHRMTQKERDAILRRMN